MGALRASPNFYIMPLTDNCPMPVGRYKGTAMANVPADYLIQLYAQGTTNREVMDYIRDNADVLEMEIKKMISDNANDSY